MRKNRWTISRIGLINFWYYDEQEFRFEDGKLLLRGSNGSGKSVTMQSFIPLLFDGNKSPERLDPFGSRARKLENYLLGEDGGDREENTGYLYMEFVKPETGNYLTIGMGLRAKRGRPVDFWGFSITDGRRIGKDLMLYKDIGDKIPLSKIELRNRITDGGQLLEGQKEYMEMVNRLLFGYEDIDEYDELIKLLVQIRTPKLSKEFRPTVIYEIMNNSLQPLSDDDLRPLSEAIENMDKIKDKLDILRESKKAADRLSAVYDRYNRFVLMEKSGEYIAGEEKLAGARNSAENLRGKIKEYNRNHDQAENEKQTLTQRQTALEHKKQELEQHDAFKARQQLSRLREELRELGVQNENKNNALSQKRELEKKLNRGTDEQKAAIEERKSEIEALLDEMDQTAGEFFFDEQKFAADEIRSSIKGLVADTEDENGNKGESESKTGTYNFKLLKAETDRYRGRITAVRKALDEQSAFERGYDDALKALEQAKNEREGAHRQVEKAEDLFDETKDEFIEKVYTWATDNTLLKVPKEEMPGILRAVNSYGAQGTYDDILAEVRRHYNAAENTINREMLEEEACRKAQANLLSQKQAELEEWKAKKDPEPERAQNTVISRKALEEKGIPFLPLYKAADFKDDVPEETRGRIEEALADMGLLDALIIPDKYVAGLPQPLFEEGDRYIEPSPKFFRQELSMLLKPVVPKDGSITFEDIDNVLKSILMDDKKSGTYLNEQGEYCIGLLSGNTSGSCRSRFLGAEARRRYRQQIMDGLEAEIGEIKAGISRYDRAIAMLKDKLDTLGKELKAFPGRQDLEVALDTLSMAGRALQSAEKEVLHRQEAADKLYAELKAAREKVHGLAHGLEIPLFPEAYREAEESSDQYREKVSELEICYSKLLEAAQRLSILRTSLDEALGDIDRIYEDLRGIRREMEAAESKCRNLEEILKQKDYDSIKSEIEDCINGLRDIPSKLEAAIRDSQDSKAKAQAASAELESVELQVKGLENLANIVRESFTQEYELGYAVGPEEGLKPLEAAKKACAELKADDKGVRVRDDYTSALYDRYRETVQYLLEYNVRIDMLFEVHDLPEDEAAAKLLAQRRRLGIMAKVQGREADFYTMTDFIAQSIEENEKLLKESDRQLFEDILANTVGKKIRGKIYHSEQWVKKINGLMESMDTSSGLSFSLSWKNRAAESEDQLDTRELVQLLQTDAVLLSEEDMGRLTAHFRSKIAQARKRMEASDSVQSFHTVMKDILDYRKWFEFQLFYKKTGENRKELTDNAFYKFSGGEKAMAMYVPLFSSVYARFDGARGDCPRVISLDEAFAGVDDNNIADMFRLVEELKLDYMINSQVLWGDYETVPALSIYELIRPNNADFVTTIHYLWNGKVRKLAEE